MQHRKKLAVIGTVGIPGKYGGFETLTEHLVEHLHYDYEMTVYCSAPKYKGQTHVKNHKGAKLVYLPLQANGIQSIPYDTISIIHALFYADVLLILGVAGAWILPFVKWFTNKKIVISIDGIEWKRDKWNFIAKAYLKWAEGIAVKYSHQDISDNEAIQDYTAEKYKTLSAVVEYGADHVAPQPLTDEILQEYPFLRKPYAFNVSRIEPENNTHYVLEAFAKLPAYTLVMVGNWNHSEYGMLLRSTYSAYGNIHMLDAIYDQEKLDALRSNAYIYIHGHSAGGTNPSLVEAMYLSLPVFAYDVSYNRCTTEHQAHYFDDVASLMELIKSTSIHDIVDNRERMKVIADRRYIWSVVAKKYQFIIDSCFSTNAKTDVIPKISNYPSTVLEKKEIGHLKYALTFNEKE